MYTSTNTYTEKGARGIFFPSVVAGCYEETAPVDFLYVKDNHLGNVRVTVSDRKNANSTANLFSYTNYYAFGTELTGKSYNPTSYTFGYNGKMKDDDIFNSSGSSYDFGERMLNTRGVPEFSSPDKYFKKRSDLSPYLYAGNTPISAIDNQGDSIYFIGTDADFTKGLSTLLQTPSGKDILLKYYSSTTKDIYITVSQTDIPDAKAATFPADLSNNIIKNGIVDLYNQPGPLKIDPEGFQNFQGIDVSRSKGKEISFIAIDGAEFTRLGKYKYAETIMHEIYSHVQEALLDNPVNKDEATKRWNLEHDILYGDMGYERDGTPKGKNMYQQIWKELNVLKKAEDASNQKTSTPANTGGQPANEGKSSPKFPTSKNKTKGL